MGRFGSSPLPTSTTPLRTSRVSSITERAAHPGTPAEQLLRYPPTLLHSVGGLFVLPVVLVLNVYKPQGLTPYEWRKLEGQRRDTVRRDHAWAHRLTGRWRDRLPISNPTRTGA
jgi:hypothetical protein